MTTQTATFGAGCFWGVEYVFERVPGVLRTEVGYAGGHTENPTYRDAVGPWRANLPVVDLP